MAGAVEAKEYIRMMESVGFTVLTADGGEAAIATAKAKKPGLILINNPWGESNAAGRRRSSPGHLTPSAPP